MDIAKRDDLFEKIKKNKVSYKEFLKHAEKIDAEYRENFPNNELDTIEEYNRAYKEKLIVLNKEKEKLDLEWKELKDELSELLKTNE